MLRIVQLCKGSLRWRDVLAVSVAALFALPSPLATAAALAMVAVVVALIAWALQLMQAASDRREFSLMLAGCMVCSAAVGLATVMVLTLTSGERFASLLGTSPAEATVRLESAARLGPVILPRDGSL